MQGKIAKWWMPDDIVFVEEMPHTATGKLYKLQLREQFKEHALFPLKLNSEDTKCLHFRCTAQTYVI